MSYFILEPSDFKEVARLPADVKNSWLKETLKEIKILINNQTFLMYDPYKGDPVTSGMDIYKERIQSDGNPDKLKLRILFKRDLQN